MKQKAVPVINRTIWMVLAGFIVVQNLFLVLTAEPKKEKESRPGLDHNKTVQAGYPAIICSAEDSDGNTASYRVYKEKEYIIVPDQYDTNHYLVVDEINGTVGNNKFSASRCQFK